MDVSLGPSGKTHLKSAVKVRPEGLGDWAYNTQEDVFSKALMEKRQEWLRN